MKAVISRIALSSLIVFGSACDESSTPSIRGIGDEVARFAVRSSDFRAATSISLLRADGSILVDDYVHSGSTAPGLTLAFGGDVDFPSLAEPGVLTVIDRFGSDVITRIRLEDGAVLGQFRTQGASTSGFSSNPQDILHIDATNAFVVRYTQNLDASAADDVRGSDLMGFDPSTMTLTSARIDLSGLATTVDVGGTATLVNVGPRRVVRLGDYAAIGLDLLTPDYSDAAPGRVALVDLRDSSVTDYEVGHGLKNCGGITAVPGRADAIAIVCTGLANRNEESGVVIAALDATSGTMSEVRSFLTTGLDHDFVLDSFVAIDEHVFVGTHLAGYVETDTPDRLVRVEIESGAHTEMFASAKSSQLFTQGAFDPSTGLLLVPDTAVGIRRFQRGTDGSFTEGATIAVRGHGLAARAIALLR